MSEAKEQSRQADEKQIESVSGRAGNGQTEICHTWTVQHSESHAMNLRTFLVA